MHAAGPLLQEQIAEAGRLLRVAVESLIKA